ncbi:epimerase [Ruminococcus sp.]|uniref:epimerase n=1 Tax=Ruminococcus sp. TaxID=41978 RepID=UPI0025EE967E|nr:epimerase [Ruminococcus sp.]
MELLLLGGTGAMGVPLVNILSERKDVTVYVTSRSEKESKGNVNYIKGNAKDYSFFESLLNKHYDAIIDFLVYATDEFKKRLSLVLEHTDQYFFFSSARCYADNKGLITEDSPRLVDVCKDEEYLATDEYGLAKGKEENILRSGNSKNWTIIRPYITYNSYRIQLGVYEKENWLKRALEGQTVVFPSDIADSLTSLTYGPDVAKVISLLIGNQKAYGKTFHITTGETHTWREICEFYISEIEKITGKKIKVIYPENSEGLQKVWNPWQIKYDRLFDRAFDNSKIESVIGDFEFKSTFEGLSECLNQFLKAPKWLNMNWKYEAWCDKQSGEFTPLSSISGNRTKLTYLKHRILGK